MISSVSQANLAALSINGINLVHFPTSKFLGILVDNKLNFALHIRDTWTMVSRCIGACKKLYLMISSAVLRNLFFKLIFQFSTCSIEIGGHSSVTQLNRLDSKLNKSVTTIGKEPTRREIYIKLNSMPLRYVMYVNIL